jgi:hypothetical protein
VCKEKRKGGLGVRDIRLVNLSLLTKWRLLTPELPLWKEVLVAKYGRHILYEVAWNNIRAPSKVSNWWRSITSLDKEVPGKNWISDSIRRKVGNGVGTSFWNSMWVGGSPGTLAVLFPRLYSLSTQKEGKVVDFFRDVGGTREWNFVWRRTLFQWEEALVLSLREVLQLVVLNLEEDRWVWMPDVEGSFSVKSAYNLLVKELWTDNVLEGELVEVFDHLWDSPAPSKVIAFSWQLLYDRTPTRFNLGARGITLEDKPWECVGCVGNVETSNHLGGGCCCLCVFVTLAFYATVCILVFMLH